MFRLTSTSAEEGKGKGEGEGRASSKGECQIRSVYMCVYDKGDVCKRKEKCVRKKKEGKIHVEQKRDFK